MYNKNDHVPFEALTMLLLIILVHKCKVSSTARRRIEGLEVQLHSFLISALDVFKWLISPPAALRPVKNPISH
jgi:hypothetical protein